MNQGQLRHLEEALRVINRQLEVTRLNRRVDPRIIQGLETQKLTIEKEIAILKEKSAQNIFSIFGILDRFDEEETITLPTRKDSAQSKPNP